MLLEFADLGPRVRHLLAILFTEWTAVGLAVALLLWLAGGRLRSARAREAVLLAASLALLAWFSSLPVATAWVIYALLFWATVELVVPRWLSGIAVAALLAVQVVLPVVALGSLGERSGHAREFTAFASNVAFLRFHAYAWDRLRGGAPADPRGRFLLAMFFFPTFVNGPIEVPRRFEGDWVPARAAARREAGWRGLGRVALGSAKLALVALAFSPGWTSVLAGGHEAAAGRIWLWGALLYVWFYLSFSAWSDVAIGLGALAGRRVPENFAAPWQALDPADFWRRWHVSLGLWLRDYVYIPLGGNRRHRALNVVLTFVASAAWHVWGSVKLLGLGFFGPQAWGGFLLWGLLNAAGVLASPWFGRAVPVTVRGGRGARAVATFLFACLCWIPFFLPPGVPLRTGLTMLVRMVWPLP